MTLNYSIGSSHLVVKGECAIPFMRLIPGFSFFNVATENSTRHQFTVDFGNCLQLPKCHILHEFPFDNDQMSCSFAKSGDDYFVLMSDLHHASAPFVMKYSGGDSVVASLPTNPSVLRFALWMAYAMMAAKYDLTLIHSSVVVCPEGAVLVLGESGTGKSTHTRLWLENIPNTFLLNDDSPVLSVEEGTPFVYGSPWSGKTPCYVPRKEPLLAVVRLSQAPENHISLLSGVQSFISLQPSCPPALAYDSTFTDYIFSLITQVIKAVPVFHLSCLPNPEAALLCYNTIMAHHK